MVLRGTNIEYQVVTWVCPACDIEEDTHWSTNRPACLECELPMQRIEEDADLL